MPERSSNDKPGKRREEPVGSLIFRVEPRKVHRIGSTGSQLALNAIDLLLLHSGPAAGTTYTTPPFVVVMLGPDGQAVLQEFPAESRAAATDMADCLRAEAAGIPLREMLERYGVPSHVVEAVCRSAGAD